MSVIGASTKLIRRDPIVRDRPGYSFFVFCDVPSKIFVQSTV